MKKRWLNAHLLTSWFMIKENVTWEKDMCYMGWLSLNSNTIFLNFFFN